MIFFNECLSRTNARNDPGNRQGEDLFKNVKPNCENIADVIEVLEQIAANAQEKIDLITKKLLTEQAVQTEEQIVEGDAKKNITKLIEPDSDLTSTNQFPPNESIIDPSEHNFFITSIYAKHRLTKVGTKRSIPKYLSKEPRSEISQFQRSDQYQFDWEKFKQYQEYFLNEIKQEFNNSTTLKHFYPKIANMTLLENQTQHSNFDQKISKFLIYKDWQYSYDRNNPHEYKLEKQENGKTKFIKVTFNQESQKIGVTTTKSNFNDPDIMAIMLEILRNAQRAANSYHHNAKLTGINDEDHVMLKQFNSMVDALNLGIKNSKDQNKNHFNFDIQHLE